MTVTYACNCYCHAASITLERRELPGAFIGQDQISGCISAHDEDLVTCVQGTGVHCVYCHGLNRLTDHQDGINRTKLRINGHYAMQTTLLCVRDN